MPNINGGRLCGDVRYTATDKPKIVSICHCSHCQKESGSAFVEVVAVPNEAFSLKGGTLDDTSWLKPSVQLFCDPAQPWIALSPDTTNYARMPD